jgi:hypothetical protein
VVSFKPLGLLVVLLLSEALFDSSEARHYHSKARLRVAGSKCLTVCHAITGWSCIRNSVCKELCCWVEQVGHVSAADVLDCMHEDAGRPIGHLSIIDFCQGMYA